MAHQLDEIKAGFLIHTQDQRENKHIFACLLSACSIFSFIVWDTCIGSLANKKKKK